MAGKERFEAFTNIMRSMQNATVQYERVCLDATLLTKLDCDPTNVILDYTIFGQSLGYSRSSRLL
jgi:hypothetical protein